MGQLRVRRVEGRQQGGPLAWLLSWLLAGCLLGMSHQAAPLPPLWRCVRRCFPAIVVKTILFRYGQDAVPAACLFGLAGLFCWLHVFAARCARGRPPLAGCPCLLPGFCSGSQARSCSLDCFNNASSCCAHSIALVSLVTPRTALQAPARARLPASFSFPCTSLLCARAVSFLVRVPPRPAVCAASWRICAADCAPPACRLRFGPE